jgi:hypothetical protein
MAELTEANSGRESLPPGAAVGGVNPAWRERLSAFAVGVAGVAAAEAEEDDGGRSSVDS